MNKCRQERIEEAESRHSDPDAVHDQCAQKVLQDDPATATRHCECLHKFREITADQDYIRTLAGDIRSRSHGNAHICLNQGGSVVDAVPDHGDLKVLAPQLADPPGFT